MSRETPAAMRMAEKLRTEQPLASLQPESHPNSATKYWKKRLPWRL